MAKQGGSRHLDDLVNRCIVFVDRNGRVLDRGSHPFSSWLEMEYARGDLSIRMRVQCSPHSNGASSVRVRKGRKTVLKATGSYTTQAYAVEATVYVPGPWEEQIPSKPRERSRS